MIILAILLTAFVYLIFPIIYVANNGKVGPKKGRRLALRNTFVCALIFFLITLIIVVSSEENSNAEIGGYSLAPAFFYYFIAKTIFTDKNLTDDADNITTTEQTEDDSETDTFNDELFDETETLLENTEENDVYGVDNDDKKGF